MCLNSNPSFVVRHMCSVVTDHIFKCFTLFVHYSYLKMRDSLNTPIIEELEHYWNFGVTQYYGFPLQIATICNMSFHAIT